MVEDGKTQPYSNLSNPIKYDGSTRTHLHLTALYGAANGTVDRLADVVIDEGECGTSVSNSGVATALNNMAIDRCTRRLELPEALRVIHVRIVDVLTGRIDDVLVDIAERIERFAFVLIMRIAPGA